MPIPAGFRHCFESAAAAAGRTLSEAELNGLFNRLQGRMSRYTDEGMSLRDAAMRAGRESAEEHQAAAAIKRHNDLMNLNNRIERRQRIVARAEGPLAKRTGPDLYNAVAAEIEAKNTPMQGGRMSTEAMEKTRTKEYEGGVGFELDQAGLRKLAATGEVDEPLAEELYALSESNAAGVKVAVGKSGNKMAGQIASILERYQTLAKLRLNRAGAWIGDYAGYITSTTHDPIKIGHDTAQQWVNFISPLLDNRTFEGVENTTDFLTKIRNSLRAGIHLSDGNGADFKAPAFSGPGSMAGMVSESRLLHFKDAQSWLTYQRRYGYSGSLTDQVMMSLRRAARQEALMERFGTNPEAEFKGDLDWLQKTYVDKNPEAARSFRVSDVNSLNNLFDQISGRANMPAHELRAQIGSFLRNLSSMAHLGFVSFTHLFSAIVTKGPVLRYQGANFLEAYGNVLSSFVHSFGEKDQPEALRRLLAGVSGTHSGIGSFGWLDDTVPGTMSKITNQYFKANGLNWLLQSQKRGVVWFMSHHLGELADHEFGDLPPQTQRAFNQYNISPEDWNVLRQAPDHPVDGPNTYLTPDAAMRSTTPLTDAAREDLALKLNAYYHDVADQSIVTPGVGDRAFWVRGTRPGEVSGEVARFVMQFKLWPTAMIRQFWGREVFGGNGAGGIATGVVVTALMGLAAGYGRMLITDMLKGLTPRDPKSPETWMAALAQSGGAGILGDFLFGQTNRYGQGLAETVAGPVAGEIANDFLTMWNNVKEGNTKPLATEAARMTANNMPFANMFYARSAINYLFLNSLMESLSPGYLRRQKDALRRNTGQQYVDPSTPLTGWMNPSQHLHTFGR
jgi:hypothetical protein